MFLRAAELDFVRYDNRVLFHAISPRDIPLGSKTRLAIRLLVARSIPRLLALSAYPELLCGIHL